LQQISVDYLEQIPTKILPKSLRQAFLITEKMRRRTCLQEKAGKEDKTFQECHEGNGMLIGGFSVRKNERLSKGATTLRTPIVLKELQAYHSVRSASRRKAGITTCFSIGLYVSLTDSGSSITPRYSNSPQKGCSGV